MYGDTHLTNSMQTPLPHARSRAGVAPVLCERIAKRCTEGEIVAAEDRLDEIIEQRKRTPPPAAAAAAAEEGAEEPVGDEGEGDEGEGGGSAAASGAEEASAAAEGVRSEL